VILLLSVTVFFANAIDERPSLFVVARTISFSIVIAAAYFGLELLFDRLLVGSVPPAKVIRGPLDFAVILLVIFSFSAVVVFQDFLLRKVGEKRWQAVYFHIANGLYINTLANRLVLRFWPSLQRKRIVGYSYNVNSINEGR
jgi:NAD(P)H-quinone oxidoreductase subunit 5